MTEPVAQINRLNMLEDTLFQISVRMGEVREPDMDDMSWYTQLIARAQFLSAQSVDVEKVREVIVWLRSGSMAITANAGIAADKLEAALQELKP